MPRKELRVTNPLVVDNNNILLNDVLVTIEIEDIIVGCIRSFEHEGNQAIVNHVKVIKILKELDEITVKSIIGALRCSKAQASRYMAVIALASPFLARWVYRGALVRGYVEITPQAVLSGVRLSNRFVNPSEFISNQKT